MPFLSIAGRDYLVQAQGAGIGERVYVGERVRAFANNLISSRDPLASKRQWSFVLGPMPRASYDLLDDDTMGDAVVAVGGDAIGAAPVDCMVTVTGAHTRDGLGHQMIATVSVEEV